MRIEFSDTPEPPLFVIQLEEEQVIDAPKLGAKARGRRYDNRVAVHRLSADRVPDIDTPPTPPCQLKGGPFIYTAVTARVGLLPDSRCRFTRMRVELILGGQIAVEELRPVVCQLYPETARSTVKKTRSIETGIGLGIRVESVELKGPALRRDEVVEFEENEISIIAFGYCGSRASWDFKTTSNNPELAGDFVVYLVAATHEGVAASGELRVTAEVEDVRKRVRIPFFSPKPQADSATKPFTLTNA